MPWPTSNTAPGPRAYWLLVSGLGLWLATWIVVSWAAVQDDALIHLRYADNLYLYHFITYDGVHPNYGASSLLYVGILALLRGVTASPTLPRAVSSAVHLLLFGGLATALGRRIPRHAKLARLAAMVLLALLVTPSAVRWLDDGMETGLVVLLVSFFAWLLHKRAGASQPRDLLLGVVAFAAVMLRTELLLLCGVAFIISLPGHWLTLDPSRSPRLEMPGSSASTRRAVWIAVGAASAMALILSTMHVLLPDTAIAKSHGSTQWLSPIHDTAVTLVGAFSFGAGMLVFWLLTLGLVAMRNGLTLKTALANCFCPVVLGLSSLRGQEIQGVRYFAWTFAFSILWNILELASTAEETDLRPLEGHTERHDAERRDAERRGLVRLCVFAGLLLVELPVESVAMHRVLTRRSETMRAIASEHLEVLRYRLGVASDIGFIGYFSEAQICDLAGLVNGREAALMSSGERVAECAKTNPEFMFLNRSQFESMAAVMGTGDWTICGRYDFPNVRAVDRHYLLVRPEIAEEVCQATGSRPEPVAAIVAMKL